MHHSNRRAAYLLCAIVLITAFCLGLVFCHQGHNARRTLLAAPQWKIGDWFELKISEWRGYMIAMAPDKVEWSLPKIKRYQIIGEEEVFGYPCFVLNETWKEGDAIHEGNQFIFRKSDLLLLHVRLRIEGNSPSDVKWMKEYGQAPWIPGDIGLVPRFPVREGVEVFSPARPFLDSKGNPVKRQSEAESWDMLSKRTQGSCSDKIWYHKTSLNIVQIEYSSYVCRWVPGQLWWAQCWQEPTRSTEGNKVSFYRAALYATSRDGILDYPLPKAVKGGVMLEEKKQDQPNNERNKQ